MKETQETKLWLVSETGILKYSKRYSKIFYKPDQELIQVKKPVAKTIKYTGMSERTNIFCGI